MVLSANETYAITFSAARFFRRNFFRNKSTVPFLNVLMRATCIHLANSLHADSHHFVVAVMHNTSIKKVCLYLLCVSRFASQYMATPAAPTPIQRLKILSIGDSQAGKSCLIKRYCENKFIPKYIPTIGVDYGVKPVTVGSTPIRINFFDLSGIDAYAEIRNEFYKDTQGVRL
jgi:hypothetical protein